MKTYCNIHSHIKNISNKKVKHTRPETLNLADEYNPKHVTTGKNIWIRKNVRKWCPSRKEYFHDQNCCFSYFNFTT